MRLDIVIIRHDWKTTKKLRLHGTKANIDIVYFNLKLKRSDSFDSFNGTFDKM